MMDTRVAIKEFFPKMFCNRDENTSHVTVATQGNRKLVDKLRKKFNEEAKAIYKMSHLNIVKVYDIFEENGTAYYVMEFIDGKSLNEITKERGALPEAEAVGYIRQVADALKYVHSMNRLHLDIKPGNIMVDKNVKAILIDFGASKHYDDESGENTSTLMGVNTKGYAPIEQSTQSFTSFSPATDIYALGATLYKLLTGIVPPDANLLLAEEEALQPLPNSISTPTRNAVMAALQLRRKNRPQSVVEFLVLLNKGSATGSPKETAHEKNSKKYTCVSSNESTLLDTEDKFSRDVKELCAQTGKSQTECEKALKQTNGNKHAALIKILTDDLYQRCGNTDLGIDRKTCKKYIESADGSLDKAEKQIKGLKKNREDDIEALFASYGDEEDPLGCDKETCRKIYADSNYDKKTAEDKLLEKFVYSHPLLFAEPEEGNFITRYFSEKWSLILECKYLLLFYLLILGSLWGYFIIIGGALLTATLASLLITGLLLVLLSYVLDVLFDDDLAGQSRVLGIVFITIVVIILFICMGCDIDITPLNVD